MRTLSSALAVVMLTIGLAAPAAAHPRVPVDPPIGVDLTHAASGNVGFVARFHEHFGAAGGIVTSNDWNEGAEFFVVTDPRGLYTYDLSNPEAPELLGSLLVNQGGSGTGAALAQEDPSTDGRLVLVDGLDDAGENVMNIVSIEDPTSPEIVGTYDGTDHTWTCVTDVTTGNGCAYAYGRSDNIIDIRDPANPVQVSPGWKAVTGEGGYVHDLTEIRPGLVMSAGAQPVLMDTTDPANPVKLVHITLRDHGPEFFPQRSWTSYGYHSVEWAQGGTDDFLVMGTEVASKDATVAAAGVAVGDDCDGDDQAVIETWDARPVVAALEQMEALQADDGLSREAARTQVFGDGDLVDFVRIDSYAASGPGAFIDGKAVGNVLYCAHWMEPERDFADGGRLVAGYYNRGARFIDVTPFEAEFDENGNDLGGTMTEIGWFTGAEAYTGSAQWINDEVVYVMDYARGMDIIKIVDAEATGYYTATGSVSDRAMTVAEMEELGIAPAPAEDGVPYGVLALLGLGLAGAAVMRRQLAPTEG